MNVVITYFLNNLNNLTIKPLGKKGIYTICFIVLIESLSYSVNSVFTIDCSFGGPVTSLVIKWVVINFQFLA